MSFVPSSSSALFPLATSHLYPIRKLYQYPEYDPPAVASTSTSNSASTSSISSSSRSSSTEDGSLKNVMARLSVNDEREESSKSAPPVLSRRQDTAEQAQVFYPVSYIRGEWMQKLLELDLGKRKIRYWLSDEVLCLGSPLAPITSDFSSGLSFYEAYTHDAAPESASVYMSEEQVTWLVDELYSSLGAKNSKLTYEEVAIDTSRKVALKEFKAIRRVAFRNNVAGFRKKCGIPMITKAMMVENKVSQTDGKSPTKQNWKQASLERVVAAAKTRCEETSPPPAPTASSSVSPTILPSPHDNSAESQAAVPQEPPKAFVSLTKAERQARLQAQREEMLRKHLEQQRLALPSQRRFYRNVESYGGAALACDVESWTEDAEVLLELGMAWFVWKPSDAGNDETEMERDGGSCHYIIEETIQYRNEEIEATRWDYSLGQSETLPQKQVSDKLRQKISELSKYGPLVLVFHDASAETRYFQKLGFDSDIFSTTIPSELASFNPTWPTKASSSTIIVQDTQNLYAGWSEPQVKQINLGKACLNFGFEDEARKLHNAGNDAFATLRIWEILLEMEEYERQKPGYARVKAGLVVAPTLATPQKVKDDVRAIAERVGSVAVKPASDFPDLIELW